MARAPKIPVKCISCHCDHGWMNKPGFEGGSTCWHATLPFGFRMCKKYNG